METQGIVEPPPEWNRPDEGNPNMPRRPPEYQPPQVSHFLPVCWSCGLLGLSGQASLPADCAVCAWVPSSQFLHVLGHSSCECLQLALHTACSCTAQVPS